MRKFGWDILRLIVSIPAGVLIGLFIVFCVACLWLFLQSVYYSIFNPALGIDAMAGGLKSVVFELPLVTFGLPLLDAGICPGILTGVFAHRLRSWRTRAAAGCASGLAFCFVVWYTYALFDPMLTAGLVLLEVWISFLVGWIDAALVSFMLKSPDSAAREATAQ